MVPLTYLPMAKQLIANARGSLAKSRTAQLSPTPLADSQKGELGGC